MITGLERIAQNKLKYPESKHLNLIHYVNVENLKGAYKRINGKKATGTDKVSKDEYGKDLEANLNQLVARMKTFSYRPQPTKQYTSLKQAVINCDLWVYRVLRINWYRTSWQMF